ncbi:hypothetical protein H4R33_005925 [Dimargaris cristalligena]|uniref:CTAG/Pcc1 family n=1 Tax=Dimargaris cristalligena TaxID=215637 RepID=A0A4P9ZPS6_9FUNG|nr:hypothetical protein H4R33_005925 [Dimargaris cristalligena]RKP35444.1 CTAG/Pcc1 family [Dimargaris cristalligena]|eukprot:RKP35444.1 CTAG/Pcc1 family [Dimargaris cristalligena]
MAAPEFPHRVQLEIPFPSEKAASIAAQALAVDRDLSASQISSTFTTEGNQLHVVLEATNLRILRIATNSFFEMIIMVTNTLGEFTPVA